MRNRWFGVYPAVVRDVRDPDGMGRVEVELPGAVGDFESPVWARTATMMAGNDSGSWFRPEEDSEVLVAFEAGDPDRPYVVGALWNGREQPPEDQADAYVLRMPSGVEIRLGGTKGETELVLSTPGGRKVALRDGEQEIEIVDRDTGNRIVLEASGITIESGATVRVRASTLDVSAAAVNLHAGMVTCDGALQSASLVTETVVAHSYTNGAGNVW